MARPMKPRVATIDEVRITRSDRFATIEFIDGSVATTDLGIDADISELSDREILDIYNETVIARVVARAMYEHIAIEIPAGRPQVRYSEQADQWCPRGDVLRCVIHDGGPDNQAIIEIDEREFSLEEFGRMLTTYAGWGMRICFVPDDEIEKRPEISVWDPDDDEEDDEPISGTRKAKKAGRTARNPILGRWRIVHTDAWDQDDLDYFVPAVISFGRRGGGDLALLAINAGLDYRVVSRDGAEHVEFSWSGFEEGDVACGRGWARIRGDVLSGELFIHQGDYTPFVAVKAQGKSRATSIPHP